MPSYELPVKASSVAPNTLPDVVEAPATSPPPRPGSGVAVGPGADVVVGPGVGVLVGSAIVVGVGVGVGEAPIITSHSPPPSQSRIIQPTSPSSHTGVGVTVGVIVEVTAGVVVGVGLGSSVEVGVGVLVGVRVAVGS